MKKILYLLVISALMVGSSLQASVRMKRIPQIKRNLFLKVAIGNLKSKLKPTYKTIKVAPSDTLITVKNIADIKTAKMSWQGKQFKGTETVAQLCRLGFLAGNKSNSHILTIKRYKRSGELRVCDHHYCSSCGG